MGKGMKLLWSQNDCTLCRRFGRLLNEFHKCLYSGLEDECNATASAIYTTYHVIVAKRFVPGCHISE